MSVEAIAWARKQRVGATGRKAMLLLLADIASEHGVLWAGRKYLAEILECQPATVTEYLARLTADGFITRIERRGSNGARKGMVTILAPAGDRGDLRDPAEHELFGALIREGGLGRDFVGRDFEQPRSGFPTSLGRDSRPEPLTEPPREPSGHGSERACAKAALPEGFPEELRPHLKSVYRVLRDLAVRHEAKDVKPVSLANVVMARQRKPLVKAAHDFAAWADSQARRQKDPVAGYRNWLNNENDLAAIERLGEDGLPAGRTVASNGNGRTGRRLKDRTYRGLSWDELTATVQENVKESVTMGLEVWDGGRDAWEDRERREAEEHAAFLARRDENAEMLSPENFGNV